MNFKFRETGFKNTQVLQKIATGLRTEIPLVTRLQKTKEISVVISPVHQLTCLSPKSSSLMKQRALMQLWEGKERSELKVLQV